MAAGSAAIFFSSRMSPAAFTMHTVMVSRDTSRPAKCSIFLSLGCHTECHDSRLGSTARLLHLCRLGLDGEVPDHSTFSKNRHGRFRESDLLRKLFETVVVRCMKERLVGGEAFAVDASMIVADAHRRRGVAKVEDLDPTSSRAVAEYLWCSTMPPSAGRRRASRRRSRRSILPPAILRRPTTLRSTPIPIIILST